MRSSIWRTGRGWKELWIFSIARGKAVSNFLSLKHFFFFKHENMLKLFLPWAFVMNDEDLHIYSCALWCSITEMWLITQALWFPSGGGCYCGDVSSAPQRGTFTQRRGWIWAVPAVMLCLGAQSCPTLCNLPGSSVHGNSPGKNTGVGCHALLQGIFPTQRSEEHSTPANFPWRPRQPPGIMGVFGMEPGPLLGSDDPFQMAFLGGLAEEPQLSSRRAWLAKQKGAAVMLRDSWALVWWQG